MDAELREYLDNMRAVIARQFESMNLPNATTNTPLVSLEARMNATRTEMMERSMALAEASRTAELRQRQFETRVIDCLDALESRVAEVEHAQRRMDRRLGALEHGLLGVNERLDRLGDDTRQRFRQLGEHVR